MTLTTEASRGSRSGPDRAMRVGIGLVVAELLLAFLWFPWVVEHVVLASHPPVAVYRALIVGPEYLLLAIAVFLVGLTRRRRIIAACFALLAGLVSWGASVLVAHLVSTPFDIAQHRSLVITVDRTTLIAVPLLGALAWGTARRHGRLWLAAVPLAPLLHWWVQHSEWPFRIESQLSFRGSEAVGMTLVIVPVLLAILCCWALEQVEDAGTRSA